MFGLKSTKSIENKLFALEMCLPRRKDKVNSIGVLGQQFLVEGILNHSSRVSQP
jgi:hypothetical protein